ncbi:MAG: hypothetical protein ACRBK7_06335 [Acidimicrobiales bacterium]
MSVDQLVVEFLGEEYPVARGSTLSFGRSADLVVDDNRHLHRRLGLFDHADGMWWLHNVGSALTIEVIDRNSPSRLTLAPGSTMALVFEEAALRFQAGTTTYELSVDVPLSPPELDQTAAAERDEAPTVTGANLSFTPDQLRCMLALAEPRLLDPSALDLPTNKAAAARLDWKLTKFNRKLDNVCTKVGNAGVSGLHGDVGALATKRRERLVDFALSANLVTSGDLDLLGGPDRPTGSS